MQKKLLFAFLCLCCKVEVFLQNDPIPQGKQPMDGLFSRLAARMPLDGAPTAFHSFHSFC